MSEPRKIELLSPAANIEIAKEAILHGADAVYIGGPSHGARKKAANSIDDIRRLVDFAHTFRARVYVTVNTIIYENELKSVERMIRELYRAGVDALIVQDMGILRLDIPPIALHASTQCDTRTPEKARFLQDVGFSQIVLARELTLHEISNICHHVDVPVEAFVHGALCVSYSGRCHASFFCLNRSANRGECAQICRLPFDLVDAEGKRLVKGKHLLSLKDFNASPKVLDMLEAGVSSFKIEGRLKEPDYVKNITAYYRCLLDDIISKNPEKYCRLSAGKSEYKFSPNPCKSFNRGFTTYFLESRRPSGISQPATPKSMGEIINDISTLNNGDGISYFDNNDQYTGVMVNGIKNGKIIGNRPFTLPKDTPIHRTFDKEWQKKLAQPSAQRKLLVDFIIDKEGITAEDERGGAVRIHTGFTIEKAEKTMEFNRFFAKLGNTHFQLGTLKVNLPENSFIPASMLTEARRKILSLLDSCNIMTYPFEYRRPELTSAIYPQSALTFADNVANSKASEFYRAHSVTKIQPAMETDPGSRKGKRVVMTTRHCILREIGRCIKQHPDKKLSLPLKLHGDKFKFQLDFDCERCEMKVLV